MNNDLEGNQKNKNPYSTASQSPLLSFYSTPTSSTYSSPPYSFTLLQSITILKEENPGTFSKKRKQGSLLERSKEEKKHVFRRIDPPAGLR